MPLKVRFMSSGLGIGKFAALAGVKPSAVRYYEAEGLLPRPARQAGKRVYGLDDLPRIKMIRAARRFGFSISELRRLARLDRHELRHEARNRASDLRGSIANLKMLADHLDALSNCDCVEPSQCRVDTI